MFEILNIINYLQLQQKRQRGAALMVMLVILSMGASAMLLSSLNSVTPRLARDRVTAAALAQAKEALIGYAANSSKPGQLPCPENTSSIGYPLEGQAKSSCSLPAIGRLPWRTLGLGPLSDGNGELLWYVISPGFRTSPINSDTPAQLTVDGIPNSAVAIVFSAGSPINGQSHPPLTPGTAPDITQYLELSNNVVSSTSFISTGPSSTFNDRLLLITHKDLFSVIERRVVAEIKQCFNEYATNPLNMGRYPWATPITDFTNYRDNTNQLFGRIPNTPFTNTAITGMNNSWTGACTIVSSTGWWLDWKELVFYGLADAYKPVTPLLTPVPNACSIAGACLSVNPPSATANKKFVIIVAGKKLSTQLNRPTNKSTLSNYLETPNSGGATTFSQGASSATFNDTLVFQ